MNTGIYIITSPSGKQYVGSAKSFKARWREHRRSLLVGEHHSPQLQRASDKYGIENLIFSKLLVCSKEDLIFYEQRAMDVLRPRYNVCKVAGSTLGFERGSPSALTLAKLKISQKIAQNKPETNAKRSASLKGKPAWNKGKKSAPHVIEAMNLAKSKPVQCVETGQIFASIRQAGKWCIGQGLTGNKLPTPNIRIANSIEKETPAYGYNWILLTSTKD